MALRKPAFLIMTAALSTEWAPLGVRVNAIAPTDHAHGKHAAHFADPAKGARERLLSRISLGDSRNPLTSSARPIFLASPASDFITGQTLFVDGGWHAGA